RGPPAERRPRLRPLWTAGAIGNLVEAVHGDGVVTRGPLEPPPPRAGGLVGVIGVASRIDDQRLPVGRDLDVQHVVVAVTAVPERPAVDDQVTLLRESTR